MARARALRKAKTGPWDVKYLSYLVSGQGGKDFTGAACPLQRGRGWAMAEDRQQIGDEVG